MPKLIHELSKCCAAERMLERSGIGSEVIAQNIVPDDPYQSIGETEEPKSTTPTTAVLQHRSRANPLYSESLPGTPVQSAPDYVLNPLSIFRMARKSVPERHAPEKATTPSAPISARPDSVADLNQPDGESPDRLPNCTSNEPRLDHGNLEELQTLFMSDLGWAWQPADTAVGSGIDGAGLLPWAGGYPTTQPEPWLPVFPFPQQS